jgi:hypothetical protein
MLHAHWLAGVDRSAIRQQLTAGQCEYCYTRDLPDACPVDMHYCLLFLQHLLKHRPNPYGGPAKVK